MKNKYSITYIENVIRIYINDLLHFRFLFNNEMIIHSYKESRDWYKIEFSNEEGIILAELQYNSSEKFTNILKLLNDIKL